MFKWEKSGNYNSQIMQFLNYIINLPNSPCRRVNSSSNGEKSLANVFFEDIENLFQKVYTESNVIEMRSFDPKNLNEANHLTENKQNYDT